MTKVTSYQPSRRDPWDAQKAAHLLNRAGFGGTPEEVQSLVRLGFEGALDHVIHYDRTPDPLSAPSWLAQPIELPDGTELVQRPRQPAGQGSAAGAASPITPGAATETEASRDRFRRMRQMVMRANRQRIEQLRAWWLDRMVHTPRPLEEKLTLFWHGHFATQALKVRFPQVIYAQNELLRRNASGSFRDLVLGISRDPAMLIYLDNNRNRREHPNENYARELMELFTLGIGHYTEEDVKEAARAFTGWTMALDGDRASRNPGPMRLLQVAAGAAKPAYTFRPRWHDEGQKQFLGHHGPLNGDDIVTIILEQPACAEFVCGKLVRFFVGEDLPRPGLVAGLAQTMRRSDYQLRPVLEALFRSSEFYAPEVIGGQIKSPIQLVVGAIRQLDAHVTPPLVLNLALRMMGQLPFDPPNVAGWDGGRHWINTSTLLARYNFALLLLEGRPLGTGRGRPGGAGGQPQGRLGRRIDSRVDLLSLCPLETLKSPAGLVDHLAKRLLSTPLSAAQHAQLVAAAGQPAADDEARMKRLVHLIMSTPNYQVC